MDLSWTETRSADLSIPFSSGNIYGRAASTILAMTTRGESCNMYKSCPVMTDSERAAALNDIPGPKRWPFVGNALQMPADNPHSWIMEQAKIYGPVMRVKLYEEDNIILNTIEAVREAFIERGTDCMGARQSSIIQDLTGCGITMRSMNDEHYHVLRTTLQRGLHDTLQLEETPDIQRRIAVEVVEKYLQHPEFNLGDFSREWCTMFSSALILKQRSGCILDLTPRLSSWLHPEIHSRLPKDKTRLEEQGRKILSDVKAKFNGQDTKCVIDHFLKKQYEEKDAGVVPIVDDSKIISVIMDLSVSTYHTVTHTLNTALYMLARDISLQKRLQCEINNLFHRGYAIVDTDRVKMPQIEAFIMETMRYCPALPYLLPHVAERDTEVYRYKIPKGATMRVNYCNITRNQDVYPEPDTFNIDRFLCNGKLVDADHPARASLIPFGTDARYCPGKYLFNHYLFELICYILQHFTIETPGDSHITDSGDLQSSLGTADASMKTKAKIIKRLRR